MKLTSLIAAFALCLSASWTLAAPTKKPAKVPEAAALPAASPEQMSAADRALVGPYACEFNQSVNVEANPKSPGYIDVKHLKAVYTMKPVLSSTGALRLEDVKGRTLFLQIANKSMLMDTKAGKRLVDACIHDSQREAASK
jgi:hypothetical protein